MGKPQENELRRYFQRLLASWGKQEWWPAQSPFEVIVGAILTQNTNWGNVEKALNNLRSAGRLSLDGIRSIQLSQLEKLLRPSGYFRQKAERLKTFVAWLDREHGGSLERMFASPTPELREQLLAIKGIGPETADSILLYAGQHEIFVVDAYTRRVFARHRLVRAEAPYDDIREMVECALESVHNPGSEGHPAAAAPVAIEPGPEPTSDSPQPRAHPPSKMSMARRSELAQRYNEFHALIVQVGKHYCRNRQTLCELCPLQPFLHGKPPRRIKAVKKARKTSKSD